VTTNGQGVLPPPLRGRVGEEGKVGTDLQGTPHPTDLRPVDLPLKGGGNKRTLVEFGGAAQVGAGAL